MLSMNSSFNTSSPWVFPSSGRILLKVSGEFLQGKQDHGVCWNTIDRFCRDIAGLSQYQWVVIVGGGNFFRGRQGKSFCDMAAADMMGMLATGMNGIALLSLFRKIGKPAHLYSSRSCEVVGPTFNAHHAHERLEKGEVIICSGGLGHGAMTTDTTAVVRACELECDLILKGTKVKGIYSEDPMINQNACFFPHLTYEESLLRKLKVMDLTALTLAWEMKKDIIIFSLTEGLQGLIEQKIQYSLLTA